MDPIALGLFLFGNSIFIALFFFYLSRFKTHTKIHEIEMEKREKELKRQVLELTVLRSLSERAGYSLDLKQILEVITDSLSGLVEFATVSYIMMGSEGRVILKIHTSNEVPQQFINNVKEELITSYSTMSGQKIAMGLIDETISGGASLENGPGQVESSFNLPMMVGSELVALINVSSNVSGLYKDEDTKILYTILTQVSASASKLSQVVENEKRRLSAMISSLTDGIFMVDSSFRMTVANPALAKMLGVKKIDSLMEIVAGVGLKIDLEDAIKQALLHKNVIRLKEAQFNQKSIEISVEPVIDQYGFLLGAAVLFHDITPEHELEKMKEEFTAMVIHELRTPLTTISYGTAEIMDGLGKLSPSDIAKSMEIIKSTTGEMLNLVNDLLDVAKIESGKFEIVKKKDDMGKLIDEEQSMFKLLAESKKLQLITEIKNTIPPFDFDKRRIGQALGNLISNAIKYTDKGVVTIKVEKTDDHCLVSVVDTGEGIKAEDIGKLFSKFEQFGKGRTGEQKGTGLGLVIAKGIVEAHGGNIWGSSDGHGKGSTFSFSLPLK
jgi:two-component system, OmpR family, phosphate regulon sensor histidine kinase PhoR